MPREAKAGKDQTQRPTRRLQNVSRLTGSGKVMRTKVLRPVPPSLPPKASELE